MTDFQALINNSIKNLRLTLGMSQEKFSEKCGLSTDNYRNLEYNRHSPKSSTIDKICSTFNITPLELLRYGAEQINDTKEITDLLSGMSKTQFNMVKDFITLVRKYDLKNSILKKGSIMDLNKKINDIVSIKDLEEILASEAGDLARELDAKDGSYDGSVQLSIYNEWRASKGYKPITLPEGQTTLPFIDVVKGCYGIIRNEEIRKQKSASDEKINIEINQEEELKNERRKRASRGY